jgi:GTP-binding protein
MKFLDEAKIYLRAGNGGAGCLSFRREANVPRGGPNGGDGGRGGSVYAECTTGLNTLVDFRYQQHFRAPHGRPGQGRDRTGRGGGDVVIAVPEGTQILADDRETILADLLHPGQRVLLARGGDGGAGNTRFKTSTNRAPRRTGPGHPGEERWVWLRLKLVADVGLVGLPNAGKSTLLASVSHAKPKVADYPFTTLTPVLGVVSRDHDEFVMADIPGLIEGAHAGSGLGDRFLGHVERCGVLVHLVDGTGDDVAASYRTIRNELAAYGFDLEAKPELCVLNKCDALTPEQRKTLRAALEDACGAPVAELSGVTGLGKDALIGELFRRVSVWRADREDGVQMAAEGGTA